MDDAIDRLTPTLLPSGRTAMRQRWANLLFLHWPVPVEVLRPLIPQGLEVDTFDGTAYVGLVPFTMTGVRPTWAPAVPGLSNFHEVNVRTYVHHRGKNPGVWFFSLDAASSVAVRIARRFWNLPYHFARMGQAHGSDGSISYRSERLWPGPTPAGCDLAYRPEGTPAASRPGTLEHFLAERYLLYTLGRRGLISGRVHHTPYPLQPARLLRLDETLLAASGIARPASDPLAHYAAEVRVRVYPLRPA
ncbi:DUF2071 domain-containing protein [Isosphaeraceae bacterium EP7]